MTAPAATIRRRIVRGVSATALAVLVLVALLLIALLMVANSDWGREQVRVRVVALLDDMFDGSVRIDRVAGNLLTEPRLVGLEIADSDGVPFLTADTVSSRFNIRALVQQRLLLAGVRIVRPVVLLDQRPADGSWNWARIFLSDTTDADTTTAPGWGSWIRLDGLELVDGQVTVRMPWVPDSTLAGAARDSAVTAALAQGSRARVESVPGGYQTVYEFDELDAYLPLLRIADPDFEEQEYRIERLATVAYPFRPPPVIVEQLAGTLFIGPDSLWMQDAELRLPGTEAVASIRVGTAEATDIALAIVADTLTLSDVRAAYGALPEHGGGSITARVALRNDSTLLDADPMDITIGDARVRGSLGLVMTADRMAFANTEVSAERVHTSLIESMVPGTEIPVRGELTGSARLDGPLSALNVNADLGFTGDDGLTSHLLAMGQVGLLEDGVIAARNLRLDARPVQVALARSMAPDLPVAGVVTGNGTVNGQTDTGLTTTFDLTHSAQLERSRVAGTATVALEPEMRLDVVAALEPLDMATVARFAPDAGLHGTLSGPVRITGPMNDLHLEARLEVANGGGVSVAGRADAAEPGRRYDLTLTGTRLDLAALTSAAPSTSLTFSANAVGEGIDPATMSARLALDMSASRVDTVRVDSAVVRVGAAAGMASVDSLRGWAPGATVAARGTFGLVEGQQGHLVFRAAVDSLDRFAGYVPEDTVTTTVRPAARARRRAARLDSARLARRPVEDVALGRRTTVRTQPEEARTELPRDSLSGSLYAAGVVTGNLSRVDVTGRAGLLNFMLMGHSAREARVAFGWEGGRTDSATIRASLSVDELLAAGFALDSVATDLVFAGGEGSVAASIWQDQRRDYQLAAAFELGDESRSVLLEELAMRFDSTTWRSERASEIRLASEGIAIDRLELRDGGEGLIFANGTVPLSGSGTLDLSIRDLPIGQIVALVQDDTDARGLLSIDARLEGESANPRLRGALSLFDGELRGVRLPTLRGTFDYSDLLLTSSIEGLRRYDSRLAGQTVLQAVASVPVNLALSGEVEQRLPDAPLRIDVRADSLPVSLVSAVLPEMLSNARGEADIVLSVGGTTASPELQGRIVMVDAAATIVPLGISLNRLTTSIGIENRVVTIDSLVGYSGGRILLRGELGLDSIAAPSFDLYLVAENARVLDNDIGVVFMDAGIAMRGPYDGVYVSGAARIREGVFYVPEADGQTPMAVDDPVLLAVADTSLLDEQVIAAGNPLLDNLQADVNLLVNRGTWVRSREANVEIFTPEESGPIEVSLDQATGAILLDGIVSTERGVYEFIGRRFELRRGSVVFVGTPDINPTLQLTGEYVVRAPGSEALTISILIGGTLLEPRITLGSDAQPPISQSDLISYLALGQSSTSLLQQQGSSVTGGGSQGLVGTASEVVTQRLPAFAMNVLFDELILQQFESSASRRLGADVFNITPADVPIEAAASNLQQLNSFVVGTEMELGRYFTPRTFVSVNVRPSFFLRPEGVPATQPGLRVMYRPRTDLWLEATFEPRFLLREPTLESQSVDTFGSQGVLGLFITREWRW